MFLVSSERRFAISDFLVFDDFVRRRAVASEHVIMTITVNIVTFTIVATVVGQPLMQ